MEGGDIRVYRDASGNAQFVLDADAAENADALTLYGRLLVGVTNPVRIDGNVGTVDGVDVSGINEGMKVYHNTVDQTIGSGSWTRVELDQVVYDDWTDSFNTTTHLWTCPETARYLVIAGLMWGDMADGTDCEIRFLRISPIYAFMIGVGRPGGAGYFSQREVSIVSLTKDDQFELGAYQSSGANKTLKASEAYTFLSITKIKD